MNLAQFIKEYQAFIGSFLAIIFSIGFWYFKEIFENRKQVRNNKKEIEDIFFMAARESEEAIADLKKYISEVRYNLKNTTTAGGIHVFNPPRFNRIYVNEERLFLLKQGMDFLISQQIDIAASAAKKLNGYLDNIEYAPGFIFDGTIKLINSTVITKEIAIKDYRKDQERYLKNIKNLLNKHIIIGQRNLLRPIVIIQTQKNLNKIPVPLIDKILDEEADLVLATLKAELAE